MNLRGHSILIIDSEISAFADQLASTLRGGGAETLIVRDPYTGSGPDRIKAFAFSAAVVSSEHETLARRLGIPIVLYTRSDQPAAIVRSLEEVLGPTGDNGRSC
jgi:hypothetical protein